MGADTPSVQGTHMQFRATDAKPNFLLGTAAGTTGTLGAVAEGAIVGAGVVAGGTAAVAEAAVTTGITSAIATGAIAKSASAAGIAAATIAGPVGIAVVGSDGYTWDCWKPVVRDTSVSPSRGMILRRLASHPNIRSITLECDGFVVGTTFGDNFRLSPVNVDGQLAFHATQI
ncbi:uncharacterized protein KD926_000710 [Aspergillus affinis]|uniref:uncharacterized protein n=1 Tax=Aspergillus affinis TaxID=1070780 RepID=UPI0022FDD775|nr:uncharacterized protein KD926_000710 [Aspergillus affinis]KAI9037205.1 hypothetical protein KD926_000710 [Aspergillus affinis]